MRVVERNFCLTALLVWAKMGSVRVRSSPYSFFRPSRLSKLRLMPENISDSSIDYKTSTDLIKDLNGLVNGP